MYSVQIEQTYTYVLRNQTSSIFTWIATLAWLYCSHNTPGHVSIEYKSFGRYLRNIRWEDIIACSAFQVSLYVLCRSLRNMYTYDLSHPLTTSRMILFSFFLDPLIFLLYPHLWVYDIHNKEFVVRRRAWKRRWIFSNDDLSLPNTCNGSKRSLRDFVHR